MRRGKYEKVRTPVVSIAMYMAVVLFWLIAISVYISSGLFAKYSTTASGGDSARVIKFGDLIVTENNVAGSEGGNFYFAPGVDIQKKVTVAFEGSEAATYVFVRVETPGWAFENNRDFVLNQGDTQIMSWSVDDKWTYLPTEENAYVFYAVLNPNNPMDDWDVVKNGTVTVSKDVTRTDYKNLDGITIAINIEAYVVQANGFCAPNTELANTTNITNEWNALRN